MQTKGEISYEEIITTGGVENERLREGKSEQQINKFMEAIKNKRLKLFDLNAEYDIKYDTNPGEYQLNEQDLASNLNVYFRESYLNIHYFKFYNERTKRTASISGQYSIKDSYISIYRKVGKKYKLDKSLKRFLEKHKLQKCN